MPNFYSARCIQSKSYLYSVGIHRYVLNPYARNGEKGEFKRWS